MLRRRSCYVQILSILAAVAITNAPEVHGSEKVKICYHDSEWPPYIYFKRENGKIDKSILEGATVELFNEVFKRIGVKSSTTMIPWKRCLHEVNNFDKYGKYEMFTNGSYNEDRAGKFYITSPLYRTNQGLFYSTKKFPTPPQIDTASDLTKYKLCGIHGYNYTMYRKLGVKNEIDKRAKGLATVLRQLVNDRCDFFLSPMEPILVGKKLGVYNYSEDIAVIRLPWAGTTTFHAFISKTSPRAFELYTNINHQLQILQGSGESDIIFKKWLENGDAL